ncbi:4'-phosphopantetheinyl transferase family protein [Actinomadura rupiterrae]|uniref:4'-phosphopantetheinyl transferase family protein n=1 Tax=Actinomadura rupiterrae TaxID=559627 RepID=UPI0020A579C9|nr:4'-phosphopantetheinyl transferase superfamily protein [Actinomadura rupiterrae]MCP2334847.1 4'-phosphopantetheinyl transferase [Actinomadura rupiterrae]
MEPVTVWWAERAAAADAPVAVLDPVERARRDRYLRDADRDRFTLGVALSRFALGRLLGMPPEKVPIDRTCPDCDKPHGRPRVADRQDAPHISVSHSGDRIGVAISPYGPLGLDVEESRKINTDIARHVLAQARPASAEPDTEAASAEPGTESVSAEPGTGTDTEAAPAETAAAPAETAADMDELLVYWTRKEALLKATGDGLRVPMPHLHTTHAREAPRLLSWKGRDDLPARFVLHELHPGTGYAAHLALLDHPAGVPVKERPSTDLLH